ncbi:MAG TPA: hypothetical protein VFC19_38840 [Candidatus Limnocylindrales bacterium]|nr:hypothetical protein [Candidatus Limnocylindrales bacterium]
MSDLLWDDIRADLDLVANGVLPDGCVPEATAADWNAVVALSRSRGWRTELVENGERVPLREGDTLHFPGPDDPSVTMSIWPVPAIRVNFFVYSPDEINFDIDLRELQTQERLDQLCDFLRAMGQELRKPILITPEGASNALHPFMEYDPDLDRILAVPRG